jgi:hypothetical protein
MKLTIKAGRVFSIGNRWGIQLLDGTDGVVLGPDGLGMTKEVAVRVLDAIEQRNNLRPASRPASTKGQAVGGAPLATLGRSN